MRHLKDKEIKELFKEFVERYPSSGQMLKSTRNVEELVVDDDSVLFVDGKPLILRTNTGLLPSLKFEMFIGSLPKVIVDMGAVAHVINGAQIMRPGIKDFNGVFSKGDLAVIVDEKFGKAIALGIVEADLAIMKSMSKGRVIANVHYVGDKFWNAFNAFSAQ